MKHHSCHTKRLHRLQLSTFCKKLDLPPWSHPRPALSTAVHGTGRLCCCQFSTSTSVLTCREVRRSKETNIVTWLARKSATWGFLLETMGLFLSFLTMSCLFTSRHLYNKQWYEEVIYGWWTHPYKIRGAVNGASESSISVRESACEIWWLP